MKKNIFPAIMLFSIAIMLSGCGAEPGQDSRLTSISLAPADPSIAAGSSRQFTATGSYSDNTSKDLTASVTWSSSEPGVATINAAGLASAVSAGTTAISASKDGLTAGTTLTVTAGGASQPIRASVTISTAGTLPAGTLIGGIDVTIVLPPGVTLKSTANPPEVDAGVVTTAGAAVSNATVLATYQAPAGTLPGWARLLLADTGGFGTGAFITVNGDIALGSSPTTTGFAVTAFIATDLNGAEITGLTPGFRVDTQ